MFSLCSKKSAAHLDFVVSPWFGLLHYIFVFVLGPHRNPEFDMKIRRLTDMGVEDHQARVALSSFNWDLERATEQIFS
uniref:UBA domain-containing protein n=1 Tax=Timema cristinae TaxID=61476 RepID=A0A7R9CCG9_TIMCR|nr:unnamed protein product [Timema cristinae]